MYRYRIDRLKTGELIIRVLFLGFIFFSLTLLAGVLFKFNPGSWLGFWGLGLGYVLLYLAWCLVWLIESIITRRKPMDGFEIKEDKIVAYFGKKTKTIYFYEITDVTHLKAFNSIFGVDDIVMEGKKKSLTISLRKEKAKVFYLWLVNGLDNNDTKDKLLDEYKKVLGDKYKYPF